MRNKVCRLTKADKELEGNLASDSAIQVTHLVVENNTGLVYFLG